MIEHIDHRYPESKQRLDISTLRTHLVRWKRVDDVEAKLKGCDQRGSKRWTLIKVSIFKCVNEVAFLMLREIPLKIIIDLWRVYIEFTYIYKILLII